MSSKDAKRKTTAKKDDFIEDDGDKRIIIFVAIAILIVIGIVIALLVGCEKKEEQGPNNPGNNDDTPQTDIVVPNDAVEITEDEEGEEETTSVKKTSTKTETDTSKPVVEEETTYYTVTFVYGDDNQITEIDVEDGNTVIEYLPNGYDSSNVKYCVDDICTSEFDFTSKISSDTVIYIVADKIEYTIIYDVATTNPTTYEVGNTVSLNDPTTVTNIFVGWFIGTSTSSTYTEKVTDLTDDIVNYADSDNKIYLYAKEVTEIKLKYHTDEGTEIPALTDTNSTDTSFTIASTSDANTNNACSNGNFLGWTNTQDSTTVIYSEGSSENFTQDTDIYAVCGKAVIVYENDIDGDGNTDETVVKGYTEEEINNFDLPTPEDLGMETPTYFVKVEEESDTSKVIISNDSDLVLGNEIKLQDVIDKAGTDYSPDVGDLVEEKEKVFDGWTQEDTSGQQVEVPEDYTPTENAPDELEAQWKEQEETSTTSDDSGIQTTSLEGDDAQPEQNNQSSGNDPSTSDPTTSGQTDLGTI